MHSKKAQSTFWMYFYILSISDVYVSSSCWITTEVYNNLGSAHRISVKCRTFTVKELILTIVGNVGVFVSLPS